MSDTISFKGLSALVVEDKEFARKGYVATLKAHGFDAEAAGGVQEAIQKVDNRRFDLAWIDLGLEHGEVFTGLEGKEVIDYIRSLNDTTCVVVVTVIGNADTANDFLTEYKADAYITKERLATRSYGEFFSILSRELEKYKRKRPVDYTDVSSAFFGKDGDDIFLDRLRHSLGIRVSADTVQALLLKAGRRLLPIRYDKEKQKQVQFKFEPNLVGTTFWSRRLGGRVALHFSPVADGKEFGTVPEMMWEKGPLLAYVERV